MLSLVDSNVLSSSIESKKLSSLVNIMTLLSSVDSKKWSSSVNSMALLSSKIVTCLYLDKIEITSDVCSALVSILAAMHIGD